MDIISPIIVSWPSSLYYLKFYKFENIPFSLQKKKNLSIDTVRKKNKIGQNHLSFLASFVRNVKIACLDWRRSWQNFVVFSVGGLCLYPTFSCGVFEHLNLQKVSPFQPLGCDSSPAWCSAGKRVSFDLVAEWIFDWIGKKGILWF